MSPAPAVPEAAGYLYDELAITQPGDELRGYPLLLLLGAVATALGPLHDVARHPERLLDPDVTPAFALPYVAQFAGVHFPADTPEAEQRMRITSPPAFQRGTLAAMQAAILATQIPGAAPARFIERNGGPYNLTVIVRNGDTPDQAATEAAARSQKPAGYLLTFQVSDGPIINEMTRTIDAITATINTMTVADVT